MTPDLARTQDKQTAARAAPRWRGGDPSHGTEGWYWDASGGFIPVTHDTWNPWVAFLVFPRITSSSRIERGEIGRFTALFHHTATLPVADQVRELQTALSVNKSELARVLGVSRPTVYDWLDDGQPNADNVSRIRTLRRLLRESGVSSAEPLFPRFVRSAVEPGGQSLLDVLVEETIDEAAVRSAVERAKVLGDDIRRRRKEREARQRAAGFEEPDEEQRKAILATNVALMDWPRE